MGDAADLVAELLLLRLVTANLHIPAHQAGGQPGVLALAADGLAEVIFADRDRDDFLLLVDCDRDQLGGLECLADQLRWILTPAYDIDLLVIELADDVLHAGSAHPDASTDGIDLRVIAPDGDLGAETRFAGDGADVHGVIGNLVYLSLKQAADEIRVAARKDNLRAAAFVLHRKHVTTDAVTDIVIFTLHPLLVRHDALELAEIDHHVVALEAAHRSGNDVARTVLELLVDHFLLRLAEALHHRLLCSLDGDAAEILRGNIELKCSADLRRSVLLLCKAYRNLVELVLVVVIGNDGKGSENSGITFLGINVSTQLLDGIRTWNHFPVG